MIRFKEVLANAGTTGFISVLFAYVFFSLAFTPALIALGLWLLGVPIDWASWKTYLGLLAISLAVTK